MYYFSFFFFFNDTATTEIYTLSLHDALPIFGTEILDAPIDLWPETFPNVAQAKFLLAEGVREPVITTLTRDRKSTRLNSSHANISYAVFCLKKKKRNRMQYEYKAGSAVIAGR